MRIIRGKYRGKQLYPPNNKKVRPTTDFAKEGLFNILENRYNFEEIEVLDLFSGTGSITFEFLSRACKHVTAVEILKKNYKYIKKIGETLFEESINVINGNAFFFLKNRQLKFDIIFADPPFDTVDISRIIDMVFENKSTKQDTLLILEHSAKCDYSRNIFFIKSRKYGNVKFSFFEKNYY